MDRVGISNRETPEEEARERAEHPPLNPDKPAEDASGRPGDTPIEDISNTQTSHKAGSRSIAQKEDGSRYPDRTMPPAQKVPGAFGKEPK